MFPITCILRCFPLYFVAVEADGIAAKAGSTYKMNDEALGQIFSQRPQII